MGFKFPLAAITISQKSWWHETAYTHSYSAGSQTTTVRYRQSSPKKFPWKGSFLTLWPFLSTPKLRAVRKIFSRSPIHFVVAAAWTCFRHLRLHHIVHLQGLHLLTVCRTGCYDPLFASLRIIEKQKSNPWYMWKKTGPSWEGALK